MRTKKEEGTFLFHARRDGSRTKAKKGMQWRHAPSRTLSVPEIPSHLKKSSFGRTDCLVVVDGSRVLTPVRMMPTHRGLRADYLFNACCIITERNEYHPMASFTAGASPRPTELTLSPRLPVSNIILSDLATWRRSRRCRVLGWIFGGQRVAAPLDSRAVATLKKFAGLACRHTQCDLYLLEVPVTSLGGGGKHAPTELATLDTW